MLVTLFYLSICIFFYQTRSSYPVSSHLPFLESDGSSGPLAPQSAFAHSLRWFTDSFWNPHGTPPDMAPRSGTPAHSPTSASQEEIPYDLCGLVPSMNLLQDFKLSDYTGHEAGSLPPGLWVCLAHLSLNSSSTKRLTTFRGHPAQCCRVLISPLVLFSHR